MKKFTKLVAIFLAALMVLGCLAGVTAFAADAEASWTDGTTTVEGTLAEMGKQAADKGGTVTLLKDYSDTREKGYIISSNKSFTLDLNGHKIETTAYVFSVTEKAEGVTVIKNGTLVAKKQLGSIKGGGIQLLNVVGVATEGQCVNYTVTDSKWNKDNLVDGCTLLSSAWGVLSFNNTTASQAAVSVTFKNSTLVSDTEKSNSIVIQSKAESANVVLGEGMKMYANLTGDKNFASSKLKVSGETATKSADKVTVTVLDKTVTLTEWTTPATATKELEIPTTSAPSAPATSAPATSAPSAPATSAPATSGEAEASWTDGKTIVEGTLAEMAKQANDKGGTVKLLRDVTVTGQEATFAFNSKKSVTIDLNGKTLTTEKGAIRINKGADGVTVVKNGTIISGLRNISVVTGGLHLQNLTMWSTEAQNIDYYEATDAFNHQNLIENCTIGNTIWGVISFNSTSDNQEKACITIKNSSLIAAKGKGTAPLTLQTKPEDSKAQIAFGEGVKLYSYAKSPANSAITLLGETLTKTEGEQSVTILDKTYDMMNEWTTPATATVDLSTVIPGPKPTEKPAETPATPATPAEPTTTPSTSTPAETEKKEEDKAPTTSAPAASATFVDETESAGGSMGLIIGIVAAVVVIAVVAVVVLKKKKQ